MKKKLCLVGKWIKFAKKLKMCFYCRHFFEEKNQESCSRLKRNNRKRERERESEVDDVKNLMSEIFRKISA